MALLGFELRSPAMERFSVVALSTLILTCSTERRTTCRNRAGVPTRAFSIHFCLDERLCGQERDISSTFSHISRVDRNKPFLNVLKSHILHHNIFLYSWKTTADFPEIWAGTRHHSAGRSACVVREYGSFYRQRDVTARDRAEQFRVIAVSPIRVGFGKKTSIFFWK